MRRAALVRPRRAARRLRRDDRRDTSRRSSSPPARRPPQTPQAPAGADRRRAHRGGHPRAGVELVLGDRAQRRRGRGAPDGRAGHLPRARRLQRRAHEGHDRPGVATRPDGLVVSIPEPGLAPAIRRAVRAGIPVVSINSGSDIYRRLGVLAHVGQPEERAGFEAGRRLAAAGRAPGAVRQPADRQPGPRRALPRAGPGDARGGRPLAGARGRRPEPRRPRADRRRRAQGRHRRRPGAELAQRDRGGQGRARRSGAPAR